jgi:hypothetical protein
MVLIKLALLSLPLAGRLFDSDVCIHISRRVPRLEYSAKVLALDTIRYICRLLYDTDCMTLINAQSS